MVVLLSWQLDLMVLEVFSNFKKSIIYSVVSIKEQEQDRWSFYVTPSWI